MSLTANLHLKDASEITGYVQKSGWPPDYAVVHLGPLTCFPPTTEETALAFEAIAKMIRSCFPPPTCRHCGQVLPPEPTDAQET